MSALKHEELVEQVTNLKYSLADVEKKLSGGQLPFSVLEDFKAAVDHIRLTVWALLSSAQTDSSTVAAMLVRFRLRRASEICRQITLDANSGSVTRATPELPQLQLTLRETLDRLDRL